MNTIIHPLLHLYTENNMMCPVHSKMYPHTNFHPSGYFIKSDPRTFEWSAHVCALPFLSCIILSTRKKLNAGIDWVLSYFTWNLILAITNISQTKILPHNYTTTGVSISLGPWSRNEGYVLDRANCVFSQHNVEPLPVDSLWWCHKKDDIANCHTSHQN